MSSSTHQPRASSHRPNGGSSPRPASIAELAERALDNPWEEGRELKYYLRVAEKCRREGREAMQKGDLENAFVQHARAATLVLEKLPSHRDYHELLSSAQRHNLGLNGQDILDSLSDLKPTLVERFEKWTKAHPDWDPSQDQSSQHQEAEAEAQRRTREAGEWKRQREAQSQPQAQPQPHQRAQTPQPRRAEPPRSNGPDYTFSQPPTAQPPPPRQQLPPDTAFDYEKMNSQLNISSEDKHQQQQEEMRRRREEIARRHDERRREQQAGIAQRQFEAESAARAARQDLTGHSPVPLSAAASAPSVLATTPSIYYPSTTPSANMPTPASTSSFSTPAKIQYPSVSSAPGTLRAPSASSSRMPSFPEQFTASDGPTIMPLESPTKYEGDSTDSESLARNHDWRRGKQRHYDTHRTPTRPPARSPSYPPPITTTSPPPSEGQRILYPQLMSQHQKTQGYVPSLHSMFIPPTSGSHVAPSALLFEPETTPNASHYNARSLYPPDMLHVPSASTQPPYSYPPPQPYTQRSPYPPAAPTHAPPPPQPQHQPRQPSRADDRIVRANSKSETAELKTVNLPRECLPRFLAIAKVNTEMNRETCGLLLGKDKGHKYVVTTLLVPKQHSTSDTCSMDEEELVLQFTEERSLITLGWIHTHPSQSCFMSSVDLHTHSGFQRMLPESFAVVCAPKSNPNFGIFRLTDPPGLKTILECTAKEAFHPHPDLPIYTDADKGHVQMKDTSLEIVDLR
ncbi:hypothetical protein EYR40_000457 [Pleurotus pulmonarius]|nr:hypothetical protein EYR36_004195 [Pleurotus pulmonarius]KAF4579379.1 hypothetical protein EYR36_001189 [Pleurotus pulmonarius]KAF4603294.1 hypothetical protein EYR38_003707 [Pleurotus pulmonarius]KAF4608113.1 hypothetical protein EYR40_000457 [Pleurotus pulmonarius]